MFAMMGLTVFFAAFYLLIRRKMDDAQPTEEELAENAGIGVMGVW